MPVISSRYWNMVHGAKPEDVKKDLEGLQTMRGPRTEHGILPQMQRSWSEGRCPAPEAGRNRFHELYPGLNCLPEE